MIKLTTRWSSMNSTYVVRSRKSLKLVKLGKITTHFFSEPFWLISLFAMLREFMNYRRWALTKDKMPNYLISIKLFSKLEFKPMSFA